MTSHERRSRSRILVPLLVAAGGIALGAGGIALVRPLASGGAQQLTAAAEKHAGAKSLSGAAVRARIEPSVVDVTATLTYDNETASGTGFAVTVPSGGRSALILTNNHVIRDATSVVVTVPATQQAYPASIVGVDVTADIAVLSISASAGLRSAPLGDSAGLGGGTPVISFGNQAGAGGSPTVSSGVISGTGRTIQADDGAAGFSETLHGMLATSAKIEPGDSGGPLASGTGTVVGVDTAAGTGGTSTGYAIPINAAMAAERQIVARRPGQGVSLGVDGFLGVIVGSGTATSPATQRTQERGSTAVSAGSRTQPGCVPTQEDATVPATIAPARAGALVVGVLCGTSAQRAGIAPGDVITGADGHRVNSPNALTTLVSKSAPGSVMQVTWVAVSGGTHTGRIRLGPAPAV